METNKKLKNKIGIECLIETALGMSNIKEIAKSSERLEALHFGVADYAASLRARTVVIGGLNPDYPGDQWHHGLSQLVMTCRAYGLRAIDGPFGDFNDPDAYVEAAKRGAASPPPPALLTMMSIFPKCSTVWSTRPSQTA